MLRRPAQAGRVANCREREKSESAGCAVYPDETGVEATVAMPASDEGGVSPDLIEASDADLIGRAAQGEARALEVLYDRYSGVVFSFALRIVADRPLAEDLGWNDPDIGIEWPFRDPILSMRDQNAPTLQDYLKKPAFK